jgi:hypothetical protein
LDILLKGSPILTVEENTEIFDAVHHLKGGGGRETCIIERFTTIN